MINLLEEREQELQTQIREMANKTEYHLKISWNKDGMAREVERQRADIKMNLKQASSEAVRREQVIQAGQIVDQIAAKWKRDFADPALEEISQLAVQVRPDKPKGIRCLVDASFLVEQSKQAQFRKRIDDLDARSQGNLDFQLTGPLAPYDFVSLLSTQEKSA